ncbi:hypothetical protein GOV03_05035 [Candidatus Woesearchaeota archaeon]|nr:hypothetical protein [Candidatus Woesearchaeota archaeon]
MILRYIPATEESCKLDPSCGSHLDAVESDSATHDMKYKLAQKCENLLEQKYNKDF